MSQNIDGSLSLFRDTLLDCIKSNKSILVTTHIDCDGLTSGAIMAKALIRSNAKCTVSTAKDMSPSQIIKMQGSHRDMHIITDLGGGFAKDLDRILGENWFVLDHHQIPEDEHDNPRVINAWEVRHGRWNPRSAPEAWRILLQGTWMTKNEDLSAMAVVSALGDRQDRGEKKSFTGKNHEIAGTARDRGLVEIDLDLLLAGRETKPVGRCSWRLHHSPSSTASRGTGTCASSC